MMGRQTRGQEQLFYEFSLDEVVPADHLVRRLDAVLDTSWVHGELAPFYSALSNAVVGQDILKLAHCFTGSARVRCVMPASLRAA